MISWIDMQHSSVWPEEQAWGSVGRIFNTTSVNLSVVNTAYHCDNLQLVQTKWNWISPQQKESLMAQRCFKETRTQFMTTSRSCVRDVLKDSHCTLKPTCDRVFFGPCLTLVCGSSSSSHVGLGCSGDCGFTLSGRSTVLEPSIFMALAFAAWRSSFLSDKTSLHKLAP